MDDEVKGAGLHVDFGARGYDPRLGRWMAVDPLAVFASRFSSYDFCLGSPIRLIDEDGKFPLSPTIREKYPEVANMLDDYFSSLAENDVVVNSLSKYVKGRVSPDQIKQIFRARNTSELHSLGLGFGVEIGIGVANPTEHNEVYGWSGGWPTENPAMIGTNEAMTTRPGEIRDEKIVLFIHNRFFQELENQLVACSNYDDLEKAALRFQFMKRGLHEFVHCLTLEADYFPVRDEAYWDNGAQWELTGPFGFTNRYTMGGKANEGRVGLGYQGGLDYLREKFVLNSNLKGMTYSENDIPGIKAMISNGYGWKYRSYSLRGESN